MRTVLVYNQKSSGHERVIRDIVEPVKKLAGGEVAEYDIKPTDFTDNVLGLGKMLRDGDLVIAAGGDGTASIAANAILGADSAGLGKIRLAVFGYGNFNDFQSNFGLKKADLGRILRGKYSVASVRPAEISLNGEFWRYATLYFTAGLLAKSTEVFEEEKVRAAISRQSRLPRLIYSLAQLGKWFWREVHVHKREVYYEVNGQKKVTDFGVMVGYKMAKILRGRKNFREGGQMGVFSLRLDNLLRAGYFVARGAILGMRMEAMREVGWKLNGDERRIWLQTEGEGMVVEDVYSIKAKKSERSIDFVV